MMDKNLKRERLINKRKEFKFTQETTAKLINVTTRYYRALEAGTSNGSIKIWQRLSKLFNENIDFLLQQEINTRNKQKESDGNQIKSK